MISVLKPGLLTSVMDLGRPGHQRHGVVVGGALDRFAARVANAIVGNDDEAALLEIAQQGPDLRFDAPALVAWCGGGFSPRVGAAELPGDRAVRVEAGETVVFGRAGDGVRAWLAVAGGIDVPLVLGSRSTYRRAGFGGFHGRPLQAGDRLRTGEPGPFAHARLRAVERVSAWSVRPDTLVSAPPAGTVRVLSGPECSWFSPDALRLFHGTAWTVTKDADRMGIRLAGPDLTRTNATEMVSEGVCDGAIQVPAGGSPIVLLASRQTVGGYPRIAVVVSVDLGRLAQLGPGAAVRFAPATLAEAQGWMLARERNFARVKAGLARLGV
jgi:antagonist of KipI